VIGKADKSNNTAGSVSDFLKVLAALDLDDSWVFRGQGQEWSLLPKVVREQPGTDWASREEKMMSEFARRVSAFLGNSTTEPWDLLALAQHHGVPTRLLDWSRGALTALWFAVREPKKPEWTTPSVVWALPLKNDDWLNTRESSAKPYQLGGTRFIEPFHISPRIGAQDGVFSVHQFAKKADQFIALDKNTKFNSRLKKIEIPIKDREKIRARLRLLGVHAATLFPDIGGLAEYISEKYKFKSRVVNLSATGSVSVSSLLHSR